MLRVSRTKEYCCVSSIRQFSYLTARTMQTATLEDDGLSVDEKLSSNDGPHVTLHQYSTTVLRQKKEIFEREGRCFGCFLFMPYCMCSIAPTIFQPALSNPSSVTSRVHFCLFMHFKEWGRASNTGKLLNVGLGNDRAGLYIFGQQDQEQVLIEKLRSRPSLILYPSTNAKNISEYRHLIETTGNENPLQLCVIDTTWSLSAAMNRNLPDDIPRVMIDKDLISGPSRFLNRKQNINKHKVSTIEAVALALQSLLPENSTVGNSTSSSIDEEDNLPEELRCYRTALEYSVDSVLKQAGKKLAYGHEILPNFSTTGNQVHFGPVTRPITGKPLACLGCGRQRANINGDILDPEVNFKNFGKKYRIFPKEEIISYSPESVPCTKERFLRERAVENLGTNTRVSHDEVEVEYRMWRCSCCRDYFPSYW